MLNDKSMYKLIGKEPEMQAEELVKMFITDLKQHLKNDTSSQADIVL